MNGNETKLSKESLMNAMSGVEVWCAGESDGTAHWATVGEMCIDATSPGLGTMLFCREHNRNLVFVGEKAVAKAVL